MTMHTACGWDHRPGTDCPEQRPLDAIAYSNLGPDAAERFRREDLSRLGGAPERIAATERLVVAAEEALQAEIDAAREAGVTWALIAAALQTSRQNAWQRFSRTLEDGETF